MYDPLFRHTPEEVFDEYIKSLYTKLNFCVWFTISVYAAFFHVVGAGFTFYALFTGVTLINPAIYTLNFYKYRNASRLIFVLSSNFYIYMSSLGLGHEGRVEFFLIPAAIVPLFIYERHEVKKMLCMAALPVISWAAINFIDLGDLPGTFYLTSSQNSFLSACNFLFSLALTFVFVSIYRNLLENLQARTIRITEQKNHELVNNKKFLLQTQMASQIGSWRMDTEFQFTNLTPQTYINMGLDLKEQQLSYDQFIGGLSENDSRLLHSKIVNAQHNLKPFEQNCHLQTYDGLKIIKIIGQWLKDDVGRYYVYGSSQDISDVAELELEYSQMKSTMQLGAIFTVCASDGQILEANEDFIYLSGYSLEELHQNRHNIFDFSLLKEKLRTQVVQTAKESKPWMGEVEYENKNGEIYWTQTLIMPIVGLDKSLKKLFFLQFDITQQKKMHTKLIQTSKLTSLGEMAGGMAHEINTPLSIILMRCNLLTDLLKKIPEISPKVFDHVAKVEVTTNRIARIVSNLKTFSRDTENDAYQPVHLPSVIEETLELCQERFKHKGIDVRIERDDLYTLGNSVELSQVIMNLLSNSCDAIENLAEKWIQIQLIQNENQVFISITDSGHGIPPAIVAKIMNPFFTTKEVGKGTGLGLSISSEKIKKHGGLLYYDEKSPRTRFVISLPACSQQVTHQTG